MSLPLDARQRAMLGEMGLSAYLAAAASDDAAAAPAAAVPLASAAPSVAPAAMVAPTPRVSAAPAGIVVPATGPALSPVLSPAQQTPSRVQGVERMDWQALSQAVASCQACQLCASRRNTVFGVGDKQADWLIVGEAPGENEDLQGEPFVGQAGKLLDNMLGALGLDRHHNVYIANVLKCRPPGNRNPSHDEVTRCEPFLRRQVELLQPRIILAMGRFAVQSLLGSGEPIGKLRGRPHQYLGIPVVVTYHPAYLLRSLPDKAKAWADLCLARELVHSGGA